ncbi:MAG: tetratricopeptide repeat protein [Candidatus Hermodarchaeota archaeon]
MTIGNVESQGVVQILNQASGLMKKSRFLEAANALEDALTKYPSNKEILQQLVVCNIELKRPQSALYMLDRITKTAPGELSAWSDKGFLHLLLNENKEGIEALTKSIELDSRNSHVWQLLGLALMGEENWAEGLDAFERSLLLDPNSAITWYNRAVCFFFLEYFQEALASVEQSFSLDPDLRELAEEWVTILQDAADELGIDYMDDYETQAS